MYHQPQGRVQPRYAPAGGAAEGLLTSVGEGGVVVPVVSVAAGGKERGTGVHTQVRWYFGRVRRLLGVLDRRDFVVVLDGTTERLALLVRDRVGGAGLDPRAFQGGRRFAQRESTLCGSTLLLRLLFRVKDGRRGRRFMARRPWEWFPRVVVVR